jgi:RHS repeat-associated protein
VGGATTTFRYDGEDHQREARTGSNDEVYYYDFAGERILTYRAARPGMPAQLVHRFGTAEITTNTSGARNSTVDIVFGGHPVARVVDHDVATARTLYHGVLGNLMAVLDGSKLLRARFGYGPYGEILYTEGPEAATFDRTYEDKPRDAATGLSYFGKRYYDPVTLTWTQADPLYRVVPEIGHDEPRRMALFAYVLNSPMKYVDPDGRQPPPSPATGSASGPWIVGVMNNSIAKYESEDELDAKARQRMEDQERADRVAFAMRARNLLAKMHEAGETESARNKAIQEWSKENLDCGNRVCDLTSSHDMSHAVARTYDGQLVLQYYKSFGGIVFGTPDNFALDGPADDPTTAAVVFGVAGLVNPLSGLLLAVLSTF